MIVAHGFEVPKSISSLNKCESWNGPAIQPEKIHDVQILQNSRKKSKSKK